MNIPRYVWLALSGLLLTSALCSQYGCAQNESAREDDALSWDSPKVHEIEREFQSLQDAYVSSPEKIPGASGKHKYAKLGEMLDELFRARLSDRELRQLARSIPAEADNGFVHRAAVFMVRYFVDHGDRESLVTLLSRQCPTSVGAYDYVEGYLVFHGEKFADPILILGDAYSSCCGNSQTCKNLYAGVRRSFASFNIEGADDNSYVSNAMQWYERNKATLELNTEYWRNEMLMPIEAQKVSPDRYAEFLRSPKRQPLFKRRTKTTEARAPAQDSPAIRAPRATASSKAPVKENGLGGLDGTWEVIKAIDNGSRVSEGKLKGARFLFHKGTLEMVAPDGATKDNFHVLHVLQGPPAGIDLVRMPPSALKREQTTPLIYELQEQTTSGIYKFEGDNLRLCLPPPGSRRRPLSFEAAKGSGETALTLRRQPAPAVRPKEQDAAPPADANAARPLNEANKAGLKNDVVQKSLPRPAPVTQRSGTFAEVELKFRLIDEASQPVRDANVGTFYSFFIQPDAKADQTEWEFGRDVISDADGIARLEAGRHEFPRHVICRDLSRGLIAVQWTEPPRGGDPLDVTLHPECRVSGKVRCEELESPSREVGWTNVQLSIDNRVLMEHRSPDGSFHFYLPPGDYFLGIMGHDIKYTSVPLCVPPGQPQLLLGDVGVAASGFALLGGKPAPELRWVDAWKSTPDLSLADLRGKWVLLTFAGTWGNAGGSFGGQQMRELLAVYDNYKERGLVILAVYWYPATVPPMNLFQDFESKIAVAAKQEWGGRELPFPIALTSKIVRVNSGGMITDAIRADYGIVGWPPSVLIDPAGMIAGGIDVRTLDGIALLDRLIGPKENPESRNGTPLKANTEPGVRRKEKGGRIEEE